MPNKVSSLNQVYPTDCAVVHKVRDQYADWIYLIEHGYIRYYKSVKGKLSRKYEHQLVASEVLGESSKRFHVHHKNESKLDNSASNLELLSSKAHSQKHKGSREFVSTKCDYCDSEMMIDKRLFRKHKNHYCSQLCQRSSQRPTKSPSKDKLLAVMDEVKNWRHAGRIFGVADNTVRNWAISYGIDPKIYNGTKLHYYKSMFQKTSAYKGVSKRKDRRRWYAHILVNQENIPLGTFETEQAAAKAYDKAALLHFGEDAYLNFPLQSG